MEEIVSITNLQDKSNAKFFHIIDQIMDLKVLLWRGHATLWMEVHLILRGQSHDNNNINGERMQDLTILKFIRFFEEEEFFSLKKPLEENSPNIN